MKNEYKQALSRVKGFLESHKRTLATYQVAIEDKISEPSSDSITLEELLEGVKKMRQVVSGWIETLKPYVNSSAINIFQPKYGMATAKRHWKEWDSVKGVLSCGSLDVSKRKILLSKAVFAMRANYPKNVSEDDVREFYSIVVASGLFPNDTIDKEFKIKEFPFDITTKSDGPIGEGNHTPEASESETVDIFNANLGMP